MPDQWADDGWTDDGAALLRALAEAVRTAREVPPRFVEAARAAYAWHSVEAELASLSQDPAAGAEELPGAGEDVAVLRTLTFVGADLTVELEVGARRLLGQVVPPGPGEVHVRTADGDHPWAVVDDLGCFVVRPLPEGVFRLRVRTAEGTCVLTAPMQVEGEPSGQPGGRCGH